MATSGQPATLDDALAFFNKGSLGRAESVCQRILKCDRQSTGALFLLALIHNDRGESSAAIETYERLLAINSNLPEANYNLGMLLQTAKRLPDAISCFRRAIELKPAWSEAHNNLGVALLAADDRNGAADCFRKALEIAPDYPAAALNLGNALVKGAKLEAAEDKVAICQRAVDLCPESGQAYHNLGVVLENDGRVEESLAALRRAVELKPDAQMWKFYLACRDRGANADATPTSYVTELFDAYADRFDEHLVGRLEYRTPQLLYAALSDCCPQGTWDILDLGCGTGLCGEVFESRVRTIVGIDLSPRMVDVARSKQKYAELLVGDMTVLMAGLSRQFDVVLAADVFGYVGDLNATFGQVAKVLRPGGLFTFSVEKCDGNGFELNPTRRFSFSLPYLHDLAARHGLEEVHLASGALRKQAGKAVMGYIPVLRKP